MMQILIGFVACKSKQADNDDHLDAQATIFEIIVHNNLIVQIAFSGEVV